MPCLITVRDRLVSHRIHQSHRPLDHHTILSLCDTASPGQQSRKKIRLSSLANFFQDKVRKRAIAFR